MTVAGIPCADGRSKDTTRSPQHTLVQVCCVIYIGTVINKHWQVARYSLEPNRYRAQEPSVTHVYSCVRYGSLVTTQCVNGHREKLAAGMVAQRVYVPRNKAYIQQGKWVSTVGTEQTQGMARAQQIMMPIDILNTIHNDNDNYGQAYYLTELLYNTYYTHIYQPQHDDDPLLTTTPQTLANKRSRGCDGIITY